MLNIFYIFANRKGIVRNEPFIYALLGTEGKNQPPFLKSSVYLPGYLGISLVTSSQPCGKTET